MSKVFFDANILLDILIPSRANHNKAIKAYTTICDNYDTLATSENILTTIEYIASKNGTSCKVISDFFNALVENFEIYSFSPILNKSLQIYQKYCQKNQQIDFEDLLQLECAIFNECDIFITEDRDIHKLDSKIDVMGLDEFL